MMLMYYNKNYYNKNNYFLKNSLMIFSLFSRLTRM